MSQYTILDRRRERETNTRLMRMVGVSVLAHLLVLSTAALAYRKPESSLREKAIKVSLHASRPARAPKPKAKISRPAPATKSIPSPKKSSVKVAQAEKALQKKTISTAPKTDSTPTEHPKSSAAVTENDHRLMDSALENISRSLRKGARAEEEAEWDEAFQDITSNLQKRSYNRQAEAVYYNAWAYPPSIQEQRLEGCQVIIYISQDGLVQGYKMVRSSGSPIFDQSVLRAIQKVKKLPPIPWLITRTPFALPFEFRPELESE